MSNSITINDSIDALANFIEPFCGSCYQAQSNRVPSYTGQFCIITPLNSKRIGTTKQSNKDTGDNSTAQIGFDEVREASYQLDIYGDGAGDRALALETVFRSGYGVDAVEQENIAVTPLYSSDAIQAPFISAESQWENRYTITLTVQLKVTITVQQDYFDQADFSIEKVD